MKNQIKATLYLLAGIMFSLSLTVTSCKKTEKGPSGADGKNGNANVIGTSTVSVASSSWTPVGANALEVYIPVPEITQDIVTKGSVTVFINSGAEWWGLPYIKGINSTQYSFGPGYVHLYNASSNQTLPLNPPTSTYRIVVVSASNKELYPTLNWQNYKEVKQVLHLKD